MSTSQKNRDGKRNTPTPSPVILLLGTIGDTTWRMFIPIISLLLVGDWIDRTINSRPWLMLIGAIIGSGIATLLIRQQLRKMND